MRAANVLMDKSNLTEGEPNRTAVVNCGGDDQKNRGDPHGPPLALRNYTSQCTRQHTDAL